MKTLSAFVIGMLAILAASSASAQTAPVAACRPATTIVASYWAEWLGSGGSGGSDGNPTVVQYPLKIANVGGAFDSIAFTAPCSGTYSFTVSFVRDSVSTTTPCGTVKGTYDDIHVVFWEHPVDGSADRTVGSTRGAWAPIATSDTARGVGTYTMAVQLQQGDAIYTKVKSDGGRFRCLADASFTGMKIGDNN